MSTSKNNEQNENETKNNTWSVYIHVNKINNKKYVGITSRQPEIRWRKNGEGYKSSPYFYNAIKKYGWDNFDHVILFTELDELSAKNKEKELIKYHCTKDREFGYNCTDGGDGSCGRKLTDDQIEKIRLKLNGKRHSEEWKENMRKIMTGRTFSEEWKLNISKSHTGELNPSARKIVLLDNFHNLIKTYNCIKYAAEELELHISHIQDVCEKKYSNTGGYIFMYYDEYEQEKENLIGKEIHIKPYRREIEQSSFDDQFIRRYESIREAERVTGLSRYSISRALNGKQKTCGEFKWSYVV